MKSIKSEKDLRKLQTWFADVISRPLNENSIQEKGVIHETMEQDTKGVILPNEGLTSTERIEIYNQQYWYRLVSIMQEEFPVLRHLLRIDKFNNLVISYLEKLPSEHFSLNHLSERFFSYLEEHYYKPNRDKVLEAVRYEEAYIRAFEAPNEAPLNPSKLAAGTVIQLELIPLELQKNVFLFDLEYDFLNYRNQICEDEDDEIFPTLVKKKNYVCVYRIHNQICEEHLEQGEFLLLCEFKNSKTITQAIEDVQNNLENNPPIQKWFQRWVEFGLFREVSNI